MFATLIKLWSDERGVVVSAELAAVMTCSVLALIVGLKEVNDSVNQELNDLARAVGSLNQSFAFNGLAGCQAFVAGSSFVDTGNMCECTSLVTVCPTPEMHEELPPDPVEAVPSRVPMPMQEGPEFPVECQTEARVDAESCEIKLEPGHAVRKKIPGRE